MDDMLGHVDEQERFTRVQERLLETMEGLDDFETCNMYVEGTHQDDYESDSL